MAEVYDFSFGVVTALVLGRGVRAEVVGESRWTEVEVYEALRAVGQIA